MAFIEMLHAAAAADMSATYRQRIDDTRLEAIASHVHKWLFPTKRKAK